MAYWSLVLLAVSVCFLAYRHSNMPETYLSQWWRKTPQEAKGGETSTKLRQQTPTVTTTADEEPRSSALEQSPDEADSTPKAKPTKPDAAVPTFSLDDGEQGNDGEQDIPSNMNGTATKQTPSLPTAPIIRRDLSSMPPPPKPAARDSLQAPASGLMPPPLRPGPTARTLVAGPTASLRVPTTGPLPNRGPPSNSQQRAATSNARGKVLLSPGHSPMDWASLTRSSNLSGVPTFRRVTPSQLKAMNGRKGKPAWSSWQGKVYNITPYLPFHPGGENELMKGAGRDGTKLFMDVHPWVNWEGMLSACLVGVIVSEGAESTSLDEID